MKTTEETKSSADEMIYKLKQIKEAKLAKKEAERKRREDELNDLINSVKNLIPRMMELKRVVDELYFMGIPNTQFFAWKGQNNIGFYSNRKYNNSYETSDFFGVKGGAYSGYDFTLNLKDGSVSYSGYSLYCTNCQEKMKDIVNKFDEFEESIINYVNNLSSKDN